MIRVAVAEDHPLLRATLRELLSLRKDIELIGEAQNGLEAVDCVKQFKPDVLVMDINMPLMDGFEAIQQIFELEISTQVILISFDIEDVTVRRATEIGVKGFLPKDIMGTQLLPAIDAVYRGEIFFKDERDILS